MRGPQTGDTPWTGIKFGAVKGKPQTTRPNSKISSLLSRSPVPRAVLTLMSGTLSAQIIAFVFQIFVAYIYSDVDKDFLSVYGSTTALVITVTAARYDLAVMLPKDETSVGSLRKLVSRLILLVSVITSLALIVITRPLRGAYHHSGELTLWFLAVGVTVALVAQVSDLRCWLTRKGRFSDITVNSVINSLTIAASQLLFGLVFHGRFSALILGTMLGQLVSLLFLVSKMEDARQGTSEDPPLCQVARRYHRMPLLNESNALVDLLRSAGTNLAIGAVAIAILGQFQLVWNIIQVPVGLIAGTVGQVFLKKLAGTASRRVHPLVTDTYHRAALTALIPFMLLYILAPWLFPFVFGAQWDQAGDFARALTPWLFMTVLASPVSSLFVVTEEQRRMLIFEVLYCIVPLTQLSLSPLDLLATIAILGLLMAAMLAGLVVMSPITASQYDAEARQ